MVGPIYRCIGTRKLRLLYSSTRRRSSAMNRLQGNVSVSTPISSLDAHPLQVQQYRRNESRLLPRVYELRYDMFTSDVQIYAVEDNKPSRKARCRLRRCALAAVTLSALYRPRRGRRWFCSSAGEHAVCAMAPEVAPLSLTTVTHTTFSVVQLRRVTQRKLGPRVSFTLQRSGTGS